MSDYSHLTPKDVPIVALPWEDIQEADNWNEDQEAGTYGHINWGALLEDSPAKYVVAFGYSYEDERWTTLLSIPKRQPRPQLVGQHSDTLPEIPEPEESNE